MSSSKGVACSPNGASYSLIVSFPEGTMSTLANSGHHEFVTEIKNVISSNVRDPIIGSVSSGINWGGRYGFCRFDDKADAEKTYDYYRGKFALVHLIDQDAASKLKKCNCERQVRPEFFEDKKLSHSIQKSGVTLEGNFIYATKRGKMKIYMWDLSKDIDEQTLLNYLHRYETNINEHDIDLAVKTRATVTCPSIDSGFNICTHARYDHRLGERVKVMPYRHQNGPVIVNSPAPLKDSKTKKETEFEPTQAHIEPEPSRYTFQTGHRNAAQNFQRHPFDLSPTANQLYPDMALGQGPQLGGNQYSGYNQPGYALQTYGPTMRTPYTYGPATYQSSMQYNMDEQKSSQSANNKGKFEIPPPEVTKSRIKVTNLPYRLDAGMLSQWINTLSKYYVGVRAADIYVRPQPKRGKMGNSGSAIVHCPREKADEIIRRINQAVPIYDKKAHAELETVEQTGARSPAIVTSASGLPQQE